MSVDVLWCEYPTYCGQMGSESKYGVLLSNHSSHMPAPGPISPRGRPWEPWSHSKTSLLHERDPDSRGPQDVLVGGRDVRQHHAKGVSVL